MTDTVTINGVLRRALLAYNARAVHAGGEAAAHVSAFLAEVAADVLTLLDAGEDSAQCELLAEAYRCLTFAADDPLGQSCHERDELVSIACHGLAHARLAGPGGRARRPGPAAGPAKTRCTSFWKRSGQRLCWPGRRSSRPIWTV